MKNIGITLLGILCFSLFAPTVSFAQYPTPNMPGLHSKYWFYRWRLRNDFMVMGDGPGQSLVAEQRNPRRNGLIKWADATIMHGYYLTMLAIEHKILESNERWTDLKNNERELYYAIKAFERLDYVSETFYSSESDYDDIYRLDDEPLPPDVNGYFFRDDVPPTFINENQWLYSAWPPLTPNYTSNHQKLTSGKTGIDYGGELNYGQSDYSGLWDITAEGDGNSAPDLSKPQHPIVNYKKGTEDSVGVGGNAKTPYGFGEESQDQVIRLLLGFFSIVKSIPDYNYGIDKNDDGVIDEYMNFHEEAKRHSTNIIGRMAGWFSGTTLVGPNNNAEIPYWSDLLGFVGAPYWTVMNPRHRQVSIGGAPFQYMVPMQIVSIPLFTSGNDLGIPSSNYASLTYNSVATTLWNAGLNGYSDWVNAKMALILNVISKSGSGLTPVPRFVANKSADKHIDGLFVPLYDYFWNWNPSNQNDKDRKQHGYNYANLMLQAAPCVGPHNFGRTAGDINGDGIILGPFSPHQDPDGIPYYWNVPFLFDSPHETWDDGIGWKVKKINGVKVGKQTLDEGWFSGVDFMLLYNLIYANNDTEQPLYHDLINRLVDYDIDTDLSSSMVGYSVDGLMLGAFENMHITSNIYGNTPITAKALDYIQIDNGLIDPFPNGSVTIETGKITCGDHFTSSNTPYSRDECQNCGIEEQIGSSVAPQTSGKTPSNRMNMPTVEEMEALTLSRKTASLSDAGERVVLVYPNPTNDFCQLQTKAELQQVVLLDQSGVQVKEFDSSEKLVDLREIASGIYTLIIKFTDYETQYVKVVKY